MESSKPCAFLIRLIIALTAAELSCTKKILGNVVINKYPALPHTPVTSVTLSSIMFAADASEETASLSAVDVAVAVSCPRYEPTASSKIFVNPRLSIEI